MEAITVTALAVVFVNSLKELFELQLKDAEESN